MRCLPFSSVLFFSFQCLTRTEMFLILQTKCLLVLFYWWDVVSLVMSVCCLCLSLSFSLSLCLSLSVCLCPRRRCCKKDFFFRRFGRSRSKARSLLETKLLIRKLLHGRRWSHEAWQIITRKITNTPTNKTTARRRSPSQICVLPFERQQSKQPTGPEPNKKKPQEICQGHSGENPLCHNRDKNMQQTNYATQKRETCELRGCQQGNKKSRFTIHCKPPQPLRVHSQVLVHVPKFRERPSTRWHKHQQEDDDMYGQVSCAPPHCGERPSGDDSAVSQGKVSDHP